MLEKGHSKRANVKRGINNKMPYFGTTEYLNLEQSKITINKVKNRNSPNRAELLDTMVHEELHALHPNLREEDVRHLTPHITSRMTGKEKHNLYNKYADSKTKGR